MAHWRDGGIGNMAGSDDRPIEEWTLLEKLNEIATTHVESEAPRSLGASRNIAPALKAIAQEAFDEIQRLREEAIHRMLTPKPVKTPENGGAA